MAVEDRDLRALLRSFRISRHGKKQLAALRFARQLKNTPDALKIVVDVTVADDLRVAVTNWTTPLDVKSVGVGLCGFLLCFLGQFFDRLHDILFHGGRPFCWQAVIDHCCFTFVSALLQDSKGRDICHYVVAVATDPDR